MALFLAVPLAVQAAACNLDSTGCQLTCGKAKFDLSEFKKTGGAGIGAPNYYTWDDHQQHMFYFDGCGANLGLTCEDSTVQNPVAMQTWGDPEPAPPDFQNQCAGLGELSSAVCETNGTAGVQCHYTKGYQGRDVLFVYTCAPTMGTPTARGGAGSLSYVISFAGPGACSAGPSGPSSGGGGLSWGSLFLILAPIFIGLYIGAGYYYNYKYKELRGVQAIPQIEYWKELPGLVKDGCIFSYQQTRIFINYLREKHAGAPADPTLKQALASDEGGGASTSYEENKA